MEIKNLEKILNGDINLIDQVNIHDISLLEDSVHVKEVHIRKMLVDFLQGNISSDELTKWAKFICLRGEYVSVPVQVLPGSQKFDEIADYYQGMMHIIQRLSTPEIDGEINEKTVRQYLKELDKYKDNDMHQFFK